MTIYAFTDTGDGYYQVEIPEGEPLPDWTSGLIPCEILPQVQPVVASQSVIDPVEKLRTFLAANPDVAAIL